MNVVYLSPHFPAHYHRFGKHLKALGANVLGIGDVPHDRLAPQVRESLTEYYRVDDLQHYDQLVRACGYFTHQYGKLDRLDSLNEYWLQTEAQLRDDFNITGVRTAEIDFIRRKSRMKERFREAGVTVARGRVVRRIADARSLIAETGYPIVAKPDAGVGALDTYKIHDDAELAAFFAAKPEVEYIAEEFVTGKIYSFDGLAGPRGELIFKTAHTYSQGIMETVNEARHVYYHSLRWIPPELEKMGIACVKAFAVRGRFFHIEFFQTPQAEYVALEVNMRPPGGFTTDMFNYANDIDIYRAWADMTVNGRTELPHERRYHCCYASRKKGKPYRYDHEQILARYGRFILQVESVPGVFSSALGDIGYIFRAPELERVLEIADFIQALRNR
jgi:phosphoribosylaminoimidazole carboxylase (NCAIR synthetase)